MNKFVKKIIVGSMLGISLFSVSAMAINQDFGGIGPVEEYHGGSCGGTGANHFAGVKRAYKGSVGTDAFSWTKAGSTSTSVRTRVVIGGQEMGNLVQGKGRVQSMQFRRDGNYKVNEKHR
ncbi:hypothetical protein [uncultured Clostridium sp.]|uniref:hypothetical protein n=1 Tax=uncultured Clostridium sp. TaxID=59620 RepID=UPI00261F2BE3|nr:hypothetical protein [uncultured Clostridium sp.]